MQPTPKAQVAYKKAGHTLLHADPAVGIYQSRTINAGLGFMLRCLLIIIVTIQITNSKTPRKFNSVNSEIRHSPKSFKIN
jgi:hypothetical protein